MFSGYFDNNAKASAQMVVSAREPYLRGKRGAAASVGLVATMLLTVPSAFAQSSAPNTATNALTPVRPAVILQAPLGEGLSMDRLKGYFSFDESGAAELAGAEDGSSVAGTQVAISAGIGWNGFTLVPSVRFDEDFGLRLPVSYAKFDGGKGLFNSFFPEPSGNKVTLATAGLLADWYFDESHRLSAGVVYNFSKIEGAVLNSGFRSQLDPAGGAPNTSPFIDIESEIRLKNKWTPTIAVGGDYFFDGDVGFSWDVGVSYVGDEEIKKIRAIDTDPPADPLALLALSTSNPVAGGDNGWEGKFAPYIVLGVTYRF